MNRLTLFLHHFLKVKYLAHHRADCGRKTTLMGLCTWLELFAAKGMPRQIAAFLLLLSISHASRNLRPAEAADCRRMEPIHPRHPGADRQTCEWANPVFCGWDSMPDGSSRARNGEIVVAPFEERDAEAASLADWFITGSGQPLYRARR